MRVNKYGRNSSLKDEITDIITDSLPHDDEVEAAIESFLNSKDMDRMVDAILEVTGEHIDWNIDTKRMLE